MPLVARVSLIQKINLNSFSLYHFQRYIYIYVSLTVYGGVYSLNTGIEQITCIISKLQAKTYPKHIKQTHINVTYR